MSIHHNFVNSRSAALPNPLDSETRVLLNGFLTPILERAGSWTDLRAQLAAKGYGISFRAGRMVLMNIESGDALCTGRTLGVPLRMLAHRLGRPAIKAHRDGISGELVH